MTEKHCDLFPSCQVNREYTDASVKQALEKIERHDQMINKMGGKLTLLIGFIGIVLTLLVSMSVYSIKTLQEYKDVSMRYQIEITKKLTRLETRMEDARR